MKQARTSGTTQPLQTSSLAALAGKLLPLRKVIQVQGVRYHEKTREPLTRALSKRGKGSKEYQVIFPNARKMHISATRSRKFEDLSGPGDLTVENQVARFIKPGWRTLIIDAGTGAMASRFSRAVGPSGAVVSLEPDQQAARFSMLRYPLDNVAHEQGTHKQLIGEIDGSFNAVISITNPITNQLDIDNLKPLRRLVSPDGLLAITVSTDLTVPEPNQDQMHEQDQPEEDPFLQAIRFAASHTVTQDQTSDNEDNTRAITLSHCVLLLLKHEPDDSPPSVPPEH